MEKKLLLETCFLSTYNKKKSSNLALKLEMDIGLLFGTLFHPDSVTALVYMTVDARYF